MGKSWVSQEQLITKCSGKPQDVSAHHCHPGAAAPSHTASSQPWATELHLKHSCLWTGPHPHQYPLLSLQLLSTSHFWNAGMVPWILPAIQAQCPSCYLACRAQFLQFLGSTLHRSTQGSTWAPWQTMAQEGRAVTGVREPSKQTMTFPAAVSQGAPLPAPTLLKRKPLSALVLLLKAPVQEAHYPFCHYK